MKTILMTLALTVTGTSAFAMPAAYNCTDAQGIFNLKLVAFGNDSYLSGTRATPTGLKPLEYTCVRAGKIVGPSLVQTAVCHEKDSNNQVQLIYSHNTNGFSALHLGQTANGIPVPTTLNCEFGRL